MVSDCPDEETLTACVDERLPLDSHQALLDHVSSCERCRQWLDDSARARRPGLESTVDERGRRVVTTRPTIGARVGRYTIESRLGAGGMGEVFAAHDPQLGRRVAIKVLRADLHEASTRARLVTEAQALARLSHPHVVSVYEIGVVDSHLFIAMELVDGGTLSQWLSETRRDWRDVLEQFLAAGRGLAAVHAAGLIHRDFKPDNVLVGRDGRVRVTDFGLARATGNVDAVPVARDAPLGTPQLTRTGALLGTPAYMAPEQLRGEPATAASDQFAFCVALYEALYQQRPFAGTSVEELLQAQQALELRPLPSRRELPRWARRAILRGLQLEPQARHPSLAALLAALEAGPRQAARRRRVSLAVAALLAGATAALVGSRGRRPARPMCAPAATLLAPEWNADRRHALVNAGARPDEQAQHEADARVLDWYAARWTRLHDQLCQAALRTPADRAAGELAATCLTSDAEALGRAATGALAAADLPPLDRCIQLGKAAGTHDADKRRQLVATYAELDRARRAVAGSEPQKALALVDAAVTHARQVGFGPLLAETLVYAGRGRLDDDRQHEAARALLYEAERTAEIAGDDDLRAQALIALVSLPLHEGHGQEETQTLARLAEAAVSRVDDDYLRLDLLRSLFLNRYEASQFDEARNLAVAELALAERLQGDKSLSAAKAQDHLGVALVSLDKLAEAEDRLRRALALAEPLLPRDSERLTETLVNLGDVLRRRGKLDEAEQLGRRALAIVEQQYGSDSPRLVRYLLPLAAAQAGADRASDARASAARALAIARTLGPHHEYVRDAADVLAAIEIDRGDYKAAAAEARLALAEAELLSGRDSVAVVVPLCTLADVLSRAHDPTAALAACDRAIAVAERTLGPRAADTAFAHMRRGQVLLAAGRAPAALAPLEHALDLMSHGEAEPTDRGDAELALARALVATHGDGERALTLAQAAAARYAAAGVHEEKRPERAAAVIAGLRHTR